MQCIEESQCRQSIKNFVLRHANPYSGELVAVWHTSPAPKQTMCQTARRLLGNNLDCVVRRPLLNRVCVALAGKQGRLNRARDRVLLAALKGDEAGYAAARERLDSLPVDSFGACMNLKVFFNQSDALAGRPGLLICR